MNKTLTGLENAIADCDRFCEPGVSDSPWVAAAVDYLLDGLEGRSVLDVGCGSSMGNYAPHLCRILFRHGSDVVGIDPMGEPSLEKFKCYTLTAEKALPILPPNRFDAVITSNFYNCPGNRKDRKLITAQIHRILKKGGLYVNSQFNQTLSSRKELICLCLDGGFSLLFDLYKFNDYLVFRK